MTSECDVNENINAENTIKIVKQCIDSELAKLKIRKDKILEDRRYFNDYFNELKDDEKKDLLDSELIETNSYAYSLQLLSRLGKQLKEPYFAGFVFCEDGQEPERYYISIHTLRDPGSGAIVTTDWRAPVASMYYESEPGRAYFTAPSGKIEGELSGKRRYAFKDGKLIKYSDIGMPSDDELLYEALSRNSDAHMRTILQTLQKEQYKIVKDYIEGVSVIRGCAGSGKSSVALHKAAYVLYTFREKLKEGSITVISPNSVFSEYISSVLPDLGEENAEQLLPEDVIGQAVSEIEDFGFKDRIYQQERILNGSDEGGVIKRNADFKAGMRFRDIVCDYVRRLKTDIFRAEDLYLDEDMTVKVDAELLKDLFYSRFSDVPVMGRTYEMAKYIAQEHKIRSADLIEKLRLELNYMMVSLSVPALYQMMYSEYPDIADHAPGEIFWEDACAVAILYNELYEPESKSRNFYLIADEAQDFTPIYLELLKRVYRGSNMLFVGDVDQRVFGNNGDFVADIKKIIRRRPFRLYELGTNYRSTKQISDYASAYTGADMSAGCVRIGSEPVEIKCENVKSAARAASEYILKMADEGYENMAVICKSAAEARRFESEMHIPYSVSSKLRIRVLPLYLAKGLEYDCAVIWDMPDELMYTACTRAMHELLVIKNNAI